MPVAIDAVLEGEDVGGVDGLIVALQEVANIDDNNDPAPENVPVPGHSDQETTILAEVCPWGSYHRAL